MKRKPVVEMTVEIALERLRDLGDRKRGGVWEHRLGAQGPPKCWRRCREADRR